MSEFPSEAINQYGCNNRLLPNIESLALNFYGVMDALDKSNWDGLLSDLSLQIEEMDVDIDSSRIMHSWVSQILDQSYKLCHNDGDTAQQFYRRLMSSTTVRGMITKLSSHNEVTIIDKRQPTLAESIEATLERFEVIENLLLILGSQIDALIIGGSMSYGPFFNVRNQTSNVGSSDIDVVCVINSSNFKEYSLHDNKNFITIGSKESFISRKRVFMELYHNGGAEIFSQHFGVTNRALNISAHFLTLDILLKLIGDTLQTDIESGADKIALFKDYKPHIFKHRTCLQQGFSGQRLEFPIPFQSPVNEGVITTITGYQQEAGRFYMGFYHHLISPEYSVFRDYSGATTSLVHSFRSIMEQQLSKESLLFSDCSLAKAHIRYPIFAPGKYI